MAFEFANAMCDIVAGELDAMRTSGDRNAERTRGGARSQAFAERDRVDDVYAHARELAIDRVHCVEQHAFKPGVRGLLRTAELERKVICRFDDGAGAQIEREADRIKARPEIRTRRRNANRECVTLRHT